MYQLIASILAPVLLAALIFQSIRADGFLWWDGLSDQLEACQDDARIANETRQKVADTAREEGRIAAEAASLKLIETERQRRVETDRTIVDLRNLVARLRPISPPPVVLPGEPLPPIVVTPPALPAACRLDQDALDGIRNSLNSQGGRR